MYWFRESPLIFLGWLGVVLLWWLGGWLLATHAFRLEKHERLLVGFGLGLVGYLWWANVLGHWLPTGLAFVGGGVLMLAAGLAFAWKGDRPWLDWADLKVWPVLAAGMVPLAWFLLVSRGLAIFDEPKNLTIISHMALGDIPPHYYLNSEYYFRYHYGFQLFGASLMRLGGMFPWSAFDLSKSIVFAYALMLGGLVGFRFTKRTLGGIVSAVILAFASGTRYLLMLVPTGVLQRLDPQIDLQGTSAFMNVPFSQALFQGWTQDGGPPIPFPFGFLNGVFSPLVIAHAGSYALSVVVIALLLLLLPNLRHRFAFVVVAVVLALWALVWESSYGLFAIGGVLALLYLAWKQKAWLRALWGQESLALLLSIPIVVLQGGTITEIARKILLGSAYSGIGVEGAVASTGFTLRWPPAIFSAHLGPLSITSPLELMAAIFELGPVILLTPWITVWAWKRLRQGEWVVGAMVFSAWVGLIAPMLLVYQAERDISRFTGHALVVWTLFLMIMVWEAASGWKQVLRYTGVAALGLMLVGGIVTAWAENSAISVPVLGYKLVGMDARVARDTWGRLPLNRQVFDPGWWRAAALTGLDTRVAIGMDPLPSWDRLRQAPLVEQVLANGYQYIYVDDLWWANLPADSQASLAKPCVRILTEYWDDEHEHFRRLLDLSECVP